MELSPRLQCMADQIAPGERTADIGTDHGYLPLYLYQSGRSPYVIMGDLSKGSLDKARETFSQAGLSACDTIHFRQGDGLEILEDGEVDTVVIAGVGALLMEQLLDWDRGKVSTYRKLILQPRNKTCLLRMWLQEAGFAIENERFVMEGKHLCEILTVVPPARPVAGPIPRYLTEKDVPDPAEIAALEYPDSLLRGDLSLAVVQAYLAEQGKVQEYILAKLAEGKGQLARISPEYRLGQARQDRILQLTNRLDDIQ